MTKFISISTLSEYILLSLESALSNEGFDLLVFQYTMSKHMRIKAIKCWKEQQICELILQLLDDVKTNKNKCCARKFCDIK